MSAHFKPQTIEALQALWVALPIKAPGEFARDSDMDPRERQMAILDAYCFALSDCSSEAVWNTVNNLRAGRIEEASKDFCPKAPKLAEYARAEHRRLQAMNRPKSVTYAPISQPWKDWRIIHRQRAQELAAKGWRLAAENLPLDNGVLMGRRKMWKPGSIWLWAISEMWSPS
jgi:hypothetical protein